MGFYTAGAGHMLYTARAFPKEYWNRIAFINEPTVHLTGQGIVEPQGAGYVHDGRLESRRRAPRSGLRRSRRMVGPDGAVWVADWYNFIAQHNPTPTGYSMGRGAAYETSMRDHAARTHLPHRLQGRAGGAEAVAVEDRPAGLLDALASDNMFWRLTAQRLLVERGQKDVVPQLIALVRNRRSTRSARTAARCTRCGRCTAWASSTTTTTEAYRAAVEALKHPAAGVRKAAAMVLPHTRAGGDRDPRRRDCSRIRICTRGWRRRS